MSTINRENIKSVVRNPQYPKDVINQIMVLEKKVQNLMGQNKILISKKKKNQNLISQYRLDMMNLKMSNNINKQTIKKNED